MRRDEIIAQRLVGARVWRRLQRELIYPQAHATTITTYPKIVRPLYHFSDGLALAWKVNNRKTWTWLKMLNHGPQLSLAEAIILVGRANTILWSRVVNFDDTPCFHRRK